MSWLKLFIKKKKEILRFVIIEINQPSTTGRISTWSPISTKTKKNKNNNVYVAVALIFMQMLYEVLKFSQQISQHFKL